jgi:hypothetical protein
MPEAIVTRGTLASSQRRRVEVLVEVADSLEGGPGDREGREAEQVNDLGLVRIDSLGEAIKVARGEPDVVVDDQPPRRLGGHLHDHVPARRDTEIVAGLEHLFDPQL